MFLKVEYVKGGTYSFYLTKRTTNIPVRVLEGILKQDEDLKKPVVSVCIVTNKACVISDSEVLAKYLIKPIEDWLKHKPCWCPYDEYIIRHTPNIKKESSDA